MGCEASDCRVVSLSSHLTTNKMMDGQRGLFDPFRGLLLYDLYQRISDDVGSLKPLALALSSNRIGRVQLSNSSS